MILTVVFVTNIAYGQKVIFDRVQPFQHESLNIADTNVGEVEVTCAPNLMCITFGNNNEFFARDIITKENYSAEDFAVENPCAAERELTDESSKYCVHPDCPFTDGFMKNGTHATFRTKLRTSQNYTQVLFEASPKNQIEINFQCSYPLEVLLTRDFTLNYQEITITEQGNFAASMYLYTKDFGNVIVDTKPILQGKDENGAISRISAEVQLLSLEKSGMFVELRDCWATPDANSANINRVSLIRNGCPVEDRSLNVLIHNSADDYYARFSHDIFAFSSSNEVHLHCSIEVCANDWCNTVNDNCQSSSLRRKRRAIRGEVQKVTELVISASPAFTYDYQDPSLRFVDGHRDDEDIIRTILDSSAGVTADFFSVSLLSALAAMGTLLIILIVRVVQRSRRFEKL
ncbi:Oidioi.mRNA.OKI2018_I69.XSR.g14201.t1.cds [Oikopleura dioica]|uniref:Oidioi.mRNA.OKI2018_I69.XSR.g14201.t1.cds n=1 Tax=Oikopleura dioica TaxID=34765 RepID=A0ABN7S935_OIKDI|nr:Oidioi.mRNA.OKI2018_I69.XSR.g14201.t1.cds [Oikopleura dioica]